MNPVFSKIIALFLFALSFILPARPERVDISLEISEKESQTITVFWENNTNKAITEPTFFIERLTDGKWESLPFAEGFGFPEIYTQHYPTEKGKFTIDTETVFGSPLPDGTYRLNLRYSLLRSNIKEGSSVCEFTV
ncbi:MAG: hypothetical protein IKB08_08085 [Clostridia bacterium]|nr:hypothetical protein [Oscillospiraceae bacterium]MBR2411666.1 hypothetical protein [Clostridia bacterium]